MFYVFLKKAKIKATKWISLPISPLDDPLIKLVPTIENDYLFILASVAYINIGTGGK